jgi:hypothetical protein
MASSSASDPRKLSIPKIEKLNDKNYNNNAFNKAMARVSGGKYDVSGEARKAVRRGRVGFNLSYWAEYDDSAGSKRGNCGCLQKTLMRNLWVPKQIVANASFAIS